MKSRENLLSSNLAIHKWSRCIACMAMPEIPALQRNQPQQELETTYWYGRFTHARSIPGQLITPTQ